MKDDAILSCRPGPHGSAPHWFHPKGPRQLPSQDEVICENAESIWRIFVKRLLFFALATLLLVPSAFGYDSGERFSFLGPGKWAQGRAYNPGYSYGYSPDAYGYGGDVDYC